MSTSLGSVPFWFNDGSRLSAMGLGTFVMTGEDRPCPSLECPEEIAR